MRWQKTWTSRCYLKEKISVTRTWKRRKSKRRILLITLPSAPLQGGLPRTKAFPSKVVNQIAGHGKLILPTAIVVRLLIPGTLETDLGSNLNRRTDPMAPHDRVLRVFGRVTGALAFLVVEEVAAEREKVMH